MIFKKININSVTLTNLVFAFFPISFIFGNFIINLNILIFCCLGIFHLKSKNKPSIICLSRQNLPLVRKEQDLNTYWYHHTRLNLIK